MAQKSDKRSVEESDPQKKAGLASGRKAAGKPAPSKGAAKTSAKAATAKDATDGKEPRGGDGAGDTPRRGAASKGGAGKGGLKSGAKIPEGVLLTPAAVKSPPPEDLYSGPKREGNPPPLPEPIATFKL